MFLTLASFLWHRLPSSLPAVGPLFRFLFSLLLAMLLSFFSESFWCPDGCFLSLAPILGFQPGKSENRERRGSRTTQRRVLEALPQTNKLTLDTPADHAVAEYPRTFLQRQRTKTSDHAVAECYTVVPGRPPAGNVAVNYAKRVLEDIRPYQTDDVRATHGAHFRTLLPFTCSDDLSLSCTWASPRI